MQKIKTIIFSFLMLGFIAVISGCSFGTKVDTNGDGGNNNGSGNQSKGPFTVECNELETFLSGLERTTKSEPYEIIVSHPVKGVLGPAIAANDSRKYLRLSFTNYTEDSSINYAAYTEMDYIGIDYSLISIVIPKTVISMENNETFYLCFNLEKIEVETDNPKFSSKDGVLYSDNETHLLRYPKSKKDLEFKIPDIVEYLDDLAASGNDYLTKIIINPGLKYIDGFTFSGCSSIKEFKTDSTVANKKYIDIDGVLFDDQNKIMYAYPANKDGKEYTVPDGIKKIETYSFYESQNLEKVILSDQVTKIYSLAFNYCNKLLSIVIPVSVTTIEDEAFRSCDNLTNIYYRGTQEQWNAINKSNNMCKDINFPTITYNYSN